MPSDSVVAAADVCQMAVAVLSLLAYLPQWLKLLRTKSSASISARAWCIWTVSSACAVFYAVVQLMLNQRGWALVISTLATLLFVVFTLVLVLRFRRHGS